MEVFQSALPRGERPNSLFSSILIYNFNPRSREGSDLVCGAILCSNANFNPRSREGSDLGIYRYKAIVSISIRAPARGATNKEHRILGKVIISIRAPARGATFLPLYAALIL